MLQHQSSMRSWRYRSKIIRHRCLRPANKQSLNPQEWSFKVAGLRRSRLLKLELWKSQMTKERTKNGQSVHGDEMKHISRRDSKECFILEIKIKVFQESCQRHPILYGIGEHTYQMVIHQQRQNNSISFTLTWLWVFDLYIAQFPASEEYGAYTYVGMANLKKKYRESYF